MTETNSPKGRFSFLQKITPKSRRSKLLALFVALILVAAVGWWLYSNNTANQKVASKLDDLSKNTNATCDDIIGSVGDTSADKVDGYEHKKELLQYQMNCFSGEEQFDKAIAAAQELRLLYLSKKDEKNAQSIERYIQSMKDSKSAVEARMRNASTE